MANPEWTEPSDFDDPIERGLIKLTRAEIQSNYDRVKWAEGLIAQLPANHDGRNSWLLNYGRSDEARAKQEARKLGWNAVTRAAEKRAEA